MILPVKVEYYWPGVWPCLGEFLGDVEYVPVTELQA